jgi:hypothetical protein
VSWFDPAQFDTSQRQCSFQTDIFENRFCLLVFVRNVECKDVYFSTEEIKDYPMHWLKLSLVFAVSFQLVSGLALAEGNDKEAKASFKNGTKAFEAKQYIEAANYFRVAYELKPAWKIWFNIGQAEAAGKRYGLALEAFESYLGDGGDEIDQARQEFVQSEIVRLRGMVGSLEVKAPAKSLVTIDEIDRGVAPLPGRVRIAARTVHKLIVRLGDDVLLDRSISVGTGEIVAVEVAAPGQSVATDEPQADETDQGEEPDVSATPLESKPNKLRTAGWVVLGTGAAVAIAGGVTGGMALAKAGELDDKCNGQVCSEDYLDIHDSADTLALVTNILLPVGAAMAIAGLVMVIVGHDDEGADEDSEDEKEITLVPGIGGLFVQGRF